MRSVASASIALTGAAIAVSGCASSAANGEAEPSPAASVSTPATAGPGVAHWKNGEAIPASFPAGAWRSNPLGPLNSPLPAAPRLAPWDSQIERYYYANQPVTNVLIVDGSPDDAKFDYTYPIYTSSAADPLVTLSCHAFGTCIINGAQIHVPALAQHAQGADGHMAVIQPDGVTVYEMWQVLTNPPYQTGETLAFSWGGDGRVDGEVSSNMVAPGWLKLSNAATESGVSLTAQIYVSELSQGVISHALLVAPNCVAGPAGANSGYALWPMDTGRQSSRAVCTGRDGVPFGSRIWYDRTPGQIAALGLDADTTTLLTALHVYGGYVMDTASGSGYGAGFGAFKIENQEPYWTYSSSDPVAAYAASHAAWKQSGDLRYWLTPDQTKVDFERHLHVLDPCVTGMGHGATC